MLTPYYGVRMQYKRDHEGSLLEMSGCDLASVDALKTIYANVFSNYASVDCFKQIILPGTFDRFVSFECPVQPSNDEIDFNTVRICELYPAGAQFVSGVLSLDIKQCSRQQDSPPNPHQLHFSSLLEREDELYDEADYDETAFDDRVIEWLSTVEPDSQHETQDDAFHIVEMDITDDEWFILEGFGQDGKVLQLLPVEELLQLDFAEYYALVLLSQNGRVPPWQEAQRSSADSCLTSETENVTHQVISLFDHRLRSIAPEGDQWDVEGRQYFLDKIEHFVLQGQTIECCLPAFPCKSSNSDKVASRTPDGAEYEALANLVRFCNEVKQIYNPGCRITIVSDGHVFSDCIGVDDNRVSTYTEKLLHMCKRISSQFTSMSGLFSPISFKNLHNLFLDDRALMPLFQDSYISDFQLKHFIQTELNPQDEKCRKLLMLSAQSDANKIVACIKSKSENSLTSLFRGFALFMLQDLARHPATEHLSKSQRKKLSEKIAFEMILRNQAYSHLVEQIFPHFVRFSIHAHRNSGPKFGIKLLPGDRFRHLTSFAELDKSDILGVGDVDSERKHLHIPTPWHNSLLEVKGRRHSYVCKAVVVREELSSPETKWEGGYFPSPRGERWMVNSKSEKQERKEREQRERQEQQSRLQEHSEVSREQVKRRREQLPLLEQMDKQLREELDRENEEHHSRVCDKIDLAIEKAAELSDRSNQTDEDDDGVVPEWMDDSTAEYDSSDFGLWRHIEGQFGYPSWIQVPFSEVQLDRTTMRKEVHGNLYYGKYAAPERPAAIIPGPQEWAVKPLPRPCRSLEEAWQRGDIAEAIVSSCSNSPPDSDVRR
jgi:pyoverdine/dityrosine biosynthesis protein Dit1